MTSSLESARVDIYQIGAVLLVKSWVLGARWAAQQRLLCLRQAASAPGEIGQLRAEVIALRDENRRLAEEKQFLKDRLADTKSRKRYPWSQRLRIICHLSYFDIPRRRVKDHFGVARSSLQRWLRLANRGDFVEDGHKRQSPRRTPAEIAQLIWEVFSANPHWGRHRVAMAIWALGIFVAASTVRNVLLRPKPRTAPAAAAQPKPIEGKPRQIIARYPNHVWSVDRTRVYRWRLWPTWVLVAVDHYSRSVVAVSALDGPNTGWVVNALEDAFARHGAPKHIISDQEPVFTSAAFKEFLGKWQVRQRFGAVGEHGSIAVTERVVLTLKQEWLRRVPIIRGMDHLIALLDDFSEFYNHWRGHMTLDGATPGLIHCGQQWQKPNRSAKTIPDDIERRVFADPRVTAYRLAA